MQCIVCIFVFSFQIIIGLSLYERIWELVKLEEPFHIQEHTFILTSYGIQSLTIIMLILGSITGNSYYILPWLVCTTPLFFFATIYAIFYATKEEISQILLNFIAVGVVWSTWYIVVKFHLENRNPDN
ncbi:hypothetical protein NQ314_020378 [Rhamnusium bicolor]|uniref:Uncharacterized protein n=1 Tax=Rhamnusium bicolor TaxID=1586634 RepID=A0AAV8WLJ6_9CUCU|nr:hypothetical protein NQ314_020378 [Rhamnusium bicolor]